MKYDNLVIEKLSCIEFIQENDSFALVDELKNKRYIINESAYDFCCLIDGRRSLRSILESMADIYDLPVKELEEDVYSLFNFLKRNRLILVKKSALYAVAFLFQKVGRY